MSRTSDKPTLFSCLGIAFGASAITAVANTVWLQAMYQGGRVSETGYFAVEPLLGHFDIRILEALEPHWMRQFQNLENWSEVASFLPRVFIAHLAVSLLLALLVFAIAISLRKLPLLNRLATGPIVRAGLAPVLLGPVLLLPAGNWIFQFVNGTEGLSGLLALSAAYPLLITGAAALIVWAVLILWERSSGGRLALWMTRVGGALCVIILAGWAVGSLTAPALPPASSGPNILFISIDSLRADHLSSYGYHRATSPNLDRLASEGVLFEQTVSSTSWTLPSHMSMFTGLDALHHGVTSDYTRLGRDVPTLAQILRANGYATFGFTVSRYVGARWGFSRGFQFYDDNSSGGNAEDLVYRVRRELDDWDTTGRERPFFVFLHLMDVHYDYTPAPPYDTFFDPDYQGSVTSRDFMNNPAIRRDMDKRDLDHIIALYDGEIRYADTELGKLFDYLRGLGEWDNTLVVLTADHGDEFFEHGWKGHRQSLYDEVLLVPLILRYPPALPQGRRVSEQVRLTDIAPTLLELTGTPGSDVVWGGIQPLYAPRSLTAVLDADDRTDASRRPAFTHLSDVFAFRPVVLYSIRSDNMKLVIAGNGTSDNELFDLSTDPGEQHNLAGQSNPLEPQLNGTLTRWKSTEQDTGTRRTATPAEQEELRGLGYIQ